MCTMCLLRGWLCAGFDRCAVAWCSSRPYVHVLHVGRSTDRVLLATNGTAKAIRTQPRPTNLSVQCMTIGAWQSVCGRKRPWCAGLCRNDRHDQFLQSQTFIPRKWEIKFGRVYYHIGGMPNGCLARWANSCCCDPICFVRHLKGLGGALTR